MRWIATGLLLAVTALYVASAFFRSSHAAWPYIGAFAEAAMVGALADWFAVSALFRQPLGLPLPHTAIIPKNKDRIADNLGDFVQGEFFSTERILGVFSAFNPVERLAGWMARGENADKVAATVGRMFAFVVDAADHDAIRDFLKKAANERFTSVDLSSLAAGLLKGLSHNDRHQALLDQMLHNANGYLNRSDIKEKVAEFLKEQMPAFVMVGKESVANWFIEKLLDSLGRKLDEVDKDSEHPLRKWFSQSMEGFVDDLKNDPALRSTIRAYQEQIAQNDDLSVYVDGMWQDVHDWLKRDLSSGSSQVLTRISSMTASLGASLLQNGAVIAAINEQLMSAIPNVLDEVRPRISTFISAKMKDWKEHEIVEKLELNIGRDLQFIRLNGTLVGGVIGLAIHALTTLAL
ncbi:hypothetical protein BZM27_06510 [Paraburkholderia steynii]|uniref:DUF445 domain-containing protein n=1 Tax=Paraburkholderia steynii TaxID=1245441 RepID=A0A4R0XP15_9BURK|nr:hypothetical protein BZM27_06510 [Paraburkholderia steynii]